MSKKEMLAELEYLKAIRNFHLSIARNMSDISLISLFNHQADKYEQPIKELEELLSKSTRKSSKTKKPRKKK